MHCTKNTHNEYTQLNLSYRPFWCSKHKKDCKIVTEPIGFICFLHCLYPELPQSGEDLIFEDVIEEDAEGEEEEKEIEDLEEKLDEEKEAEAAKQLDIIEIKNTLSKNIMDVDPLHIDAWGLILPILPEFYFGDRAYLLLADIQNVFNILEDYALSKIAKFQELEDGWVSDDASDDEKMEFNFDAKECLRKCFDNNEVYKRRNALLDAKSFLSFQE